MTFANWVMDHAPVFETITLKITRLIRDVMPAMYLWFQMQRVYVALENLNKITIAAINGNCNGGGTELSACCDFRYMIDDKDYTIGQPECLVGIVPGGGGTQRVTRLIGTAKALELMLGCGQLSAQAAKHIGLITDHFRQNGFRQAVQAVADQLSKRPPIAVDAIKQCIHHGMNTTLRHGLSIELEQNLRCLDTQDAHMALRRYQHYIDEHINSVSPQASSQELKAVFDTNLNNLEQAKIFETFKGE